ncbi:glycosyltransferase [Picosynechococcus sp. PCC 7003]|uniref:glycosyltransferase family 4 protein n=1 Tax=Picosynechococcus sp. PCC 7003 TaxID=374981 RepID=UPI000810E9B2|nr:glycosyltransferase family 4 protein [Picosynechococcus sp. PCC 7003]ANV84737.1 glycosyltransferase [Picosynechococcus sp. PCC 7003]
MTENLSSWICCQIGAREHYAIPRTLAKSNQLISLITDSWVTPTSIWNKLPIKRLQNLTERFHPDLSEVRVWSFTNSLIAFEIRQKLEKKEGWEKIIARNQWFQEKTVNLLKQQHKVLSHLDHQPYLFAYSYAALDIFRYAKSQGWKTILGQIDPGITHEKIVLQEYNKYSEYESYTKKAPSCYWEKWYQECTLADQIIVNSKWSSTALHEAGIDQNKVKIIPLAYERSQKNISSQRQYPISFSHHRPLKVLFLGNVVLNKGIFYLLQAVQLLKDQPIKFIIVGSLGIKKPSREEYPNVKWIGSVPRSITAQYYQEADVFIFPTLSDGFGLTQLEAQSWQLPIIASQYCGEVVNHGVNGLVLSEVTGETIAQALKFCLDNPQELQNFANNAQNYFENFSLVNLQKELSKITLE